MVDSTDQRCPTCGIDKALARRIKQLEAAQATINADLDAIQEILESIYRRVAAAMSDRHRLEPLEAESNEQLIRRERIEELQRRRAETLSKERGCEHP